MPRRAVVMVAAIVFAAVGSIPARGVLPGELPLSPPAVPLCDRAAGDADSTVTRDGSHLRVASFNVLHTQDPDGLATVEQRIPMLTDAIADAGVDVVGLQEVSRSGNHGLVAARLAQGLAAATGDTWQWCWFASNPHVHYEPEPQPGGGGGPLTELAASAAGAQSGNGSEFREGLALLTRFSVLDAAVTRLPLRVHEAALCVPPDPIDCNFAALFDSRALLRVRVETPSGELDVYTTHIAHGLTVASDDTKLRQVRAALDSIDATARPDPLPDIFVGDFNSVEGDTRYQAVLGRGFVDTYRVANPAADGFTAPQDVTGDTSTVSERIDFVFARRGACLLEVTESDVFGGQPADRDGGPGLVWPSDHYGVVAELSVACSATP
ncbi:MAG: endonuclease/exonuclease/phosphatase family protein [Acidimicrobiales bacterium]